MLRQVIEHLSMKPIEVGMKLTRPNTPCVASMGQGPAAILHPSGTNNVGSEEGSESIDDFINLFSGEVKCHFAPVSFSSHSRAARAILSSA